MQISVHVSSPFARMHPQINCSYLSRCLREQPLHFWDMDDVSLSTMSVHMHNMRAHTHADIPAHLLNDLLNT